MSDTHASAVTLLRIQDAVPLATALSQYVAHAAGIRSLVIKGPLAARHGLRTPGRASQDVDLLVEPARFDDLIAAFASYGWAPRPSPDFPLMLELHSRTLIHPAWNCDIDIHHYWPGFIGDATDAFEALWRRRERVAIAEVEVDTTGTADTALVLALHSLREAGYRDAQSPQMRDYAYLRERLRGDAVLARAVLESATDTGALQTARPLLLDLGFRIIEDTEPSEELRRWQLHVHARHRMTAWLLELRGATLRQKLRVVRRAVFPTATELRAIDPLIGDRRSDVVAGWWRRFARGVRYAPQALHDIRAHYRSD